MWQGYFAFDLSWRAGWWQLIIYSGKPEAEATFRGQLVIMKMKGIQRVLGGCCTCCTLYSLYTVLEFNSWSWYKDIERDDVTLCSAMMVELWTTKIELDDEEENDVKNTSGYEEPGVRLASFGLKDLISGILHAESRHIPAVSVMVNWLAHKILFSSTFPWCFPPSRLISLFLVLNSKSSKNMM